MMKRLALALVSAAILNSATAVDTMPYVVRKAAGGNTEGTLTLTPSTFVSLDSNGRLQVQDATAFKAALGVTSLTGTISAITLTATGASSIATTSGSFHLTGYAGVHVDDGSGLNWIDLDKLNWIVGIRGGAGLSLSSGGTASFISSGTITITGTQAVNVSGTTVAVAARGNISVSSTDGQIDIYGDDYVQLRDDQGDYVRANGLDGRVDIYGATSVIVTTPGTVSGTAAGLIFTATSGDVTLSATTGAGVFTGTGRGSAWLRSRSNWFRVNGIDGGAEIVSSNTVNVVAGTDYTVTASGSIAMTATSHVTIGSTTGNATLIGDDYSTIADNGGHYVRVDGIDGWIQASAPVFQFNVADMQTTGTFSGTAWPFKMQNSFTPTGTTQTIDLRAGADFVIGTGSATCNVTLTFSNPSAGIVYSLYVRQPSTARAIIFPAGTTQSLNGSNTWNSTGTWSGTAHLDMINFKYDSVNSVYRIIGVSPDQG